MMCVSSSPSLLEETNEEVANACVRVCATPVSARLRQRRRTASVGIQMVSAEQEMEEPTRCCVINLNGKRCRHLQKNGEKTCCIHNRLLLQLEQPTEMEASGVQAVNVSTSVQVKQGREKRASNRKGKGTKKGKEIGKKWKAHEEEDAMAEASRGDEMVEKGKKKGKAGMLPKLTKRQQKKMDPFVLQFSQTELANCTFIEVETRDINGILYFIDTVGNVYCTEDVMQNRLNPAIIGRWE